MSGLQLDRRELGTVLAALRFWQRALNWSGAPPGMLPIATDDGEVEPLTADEIDTLCERINVRPGAG